MKQLLPLPIFVLISFFAFFGYAQAETMYLKMPSSYQTWEIKNPDTAFSDVSSFQKTTFGRYNIVPLKEHQNWLEPYLDNQQVEGLDQVKIQQYLQEKIAPIIARERGDVTISKNEAGEIQFEGVGFESRQLDVKKGAQMIAYALENGVNYVHLPVINEAPIITVLDDELKKMGIVELIGEGQTDAGGSPYNRFYNIDTGIDKFDGYLIEPDQEVSFVEVLGPVDSSTGYVTELVIKGNKTIPEYGGGLCQVSSTMFRAVLSSGLPITARRNHSYLVSYYTPPGLDATVYIPNPDFRFVNDTGHHILIQTARVDAAVHYIFYGTDDNRTAHVIGPHYKGWTGVPAAKVEYTSTLAPGAVKIVGHAVAGLHVTWYREVEHEDPEKNFLEEYDSVYQARPFYKLIGGSDPAAAAAAPAEGGGE